MKMLWKTMFRRIPSLVAISKSVLAVSLCSNKILLLGKWGYELTLVILNNGCKEVVFCMFLYVFLKLHVIIIL